MNRSRAGRIALEGIRFRLIIVLVMVLIIGALTSENFLTLNMVHSVFDRASILGLLALGLTPVLIAGQIDLSVGSVLSMSGITTIMLQPVIGSVPALVCGLGVGLLIGLINAVLVVVFKINSLVATLGTSLIFASLALLLTKAYPVASQNPIFGLGLTQSIAVVFTPRALIFFVIAILMFIWLHSTPPGRHLYAVGGNVAAASAAGINTNWHLAFVMVLSGLMSGSAGVIQSLSNATGSPVAGSTMLIPAITAVVIGGTPLEGGRGSSLQTVGGVIALGTLTRLLESQGVPSYTQDICSGLLLILLITLDRLAISAERASTSRTHRRERVVSTNPKYSQERETHV